MKDGKKTIFIGIDGLDPIILEQMMDKGHLPSFARLSRLGFYHRLSTINPPQSPVVWATIATGKNPGEHGIYDFLHRTKDDYMPFLSILRLERSGDVKPFRAETFWEAASAKGIEATVLRYPLTFPPNRTNGRVLSGLGTPDIRGGLGTYTLYTADPDFYGPDKKGRMIKVHENKKTIRTEVFGPLVSSFSGSREAPIPMIIELFERHIICNIGGKKIEVSEGCWSDWIEINFKTNFMSSITGIVKFFLKRINKGLELYMTPVNIAPGDRTFRISGPLEYSVELNNALGPFATVGMPEDTNALNDCVIGEDAFLSLCDHIMTEREKMFFYELDRFDSGILACVFDTSDRIQHMFWRYIDPDNPMFNRETAAAYENVIPSLYKRTDSIIGRVLDRIAPDTLLIVCSDHGFNSLSKNLHLNNWLVDNGYMSLKNGAKSNKGLFDEVDWSRTKAYALGLNSLYFNVRGREKEGTINIGDLPYLKKGLSEKLTNLYDGNKRAIKRVYDSEKLYHGKETSNAPDLVIGHERGYRNSWQSAVGQVVNTDLFEVNMKNWSGEHCCDAELVPGIFFTNERSLLSNPTVLDIAPAILNYLGCDHMGQRE